MKAIGMRPGGDHPEVLDVSRPEPAPGEALIRILRVGIDGTDHEVIRDVEDRLPDGDGYLILGHEAVGVIEDPGDTAFSEGDVVVPTVRRPPSDSEGSATSNEYFERGEPDMAPEGAYVERGIEGAHGFMAEYVTSPAEFLIELPPDLAHIGFLVEPLSITEKALEHAYATRSAFDWQPESAIVLGNGSLGLITLALLVERERFDRCYCLGRRDRPDPTIDFIEELDATYIDSRETPLSEVADTHEPMDLVYEATGYSRHGLESIDALAPNGVGVLLGLPGSDRFEIDGGRLHDELVMGNRALVGTVNSHVRHFEAAVESLAALPSWAIDELVTGIYPVEEVEQAFGDDDTTIKTAVELSSHEER